MARFTTLEEMMDYIQIDASGNVTIPGLKAASTTKAVSNVTGDTTVSASASGTTYVDTKGASTTAFALPTPAPGLTYTFVCGDAAGEILLTPGTGKAIVTKVSADADAAALAPAAGTGIKNTAATNVAGDFITLTALDTTTWYGTGMAGVWASR